MRTGTAMQLLAATMILGCAHGTGKGEGEGFPLTGSMDARVQGDSVHLTLHITNISTGPVALEFSSTQQYDFLVREEDGPTVWNWSAARSFAHVLTADTVAAGESRRYAAAWAHEGRLGPFVAEGRLLDRERPVQLAIPLPLDSPER